MAVVVSSRGRRTFASMELAIARYRLKFHHPFGTAHGMRDGTDSVFVRLRSSGKEGYGEATLPPYIPYEQDSVVENIANVWMKYGSNTTEEEIPGTLLAELCPPARAAFQVAHTDLKYRIMDSSVGSYGPNKIRLSEPAQCMVTLGHSHIDDIALKLSELPRSGVLKVKLGAPNDLDVLRAVKQLDDRPLFLDANQGWTEVAQAEQALAVVGNHDVIGLEQPFAKDRWDLHADLRQRLDIPVYGDESIQGLLELEQAPEAFDGVNLKLMKCGGLDVAAEMAERARELGLKVMLGSMSESSLGCAAMASLADNADLLDLDGPWLIRNDPFQGLRMEDGKLVVEGSAGIGVQLRAGADLKFNLIGA